MKGSCLCGAVEFEVSGEVLDFVLDHCPRCRKATGSAFAAELVVRPEQVRFLRGEDLVQTYEAPVRERPPGYRRTFCSRCGGPLPTYHDESETVIPAGTVEDDPRLRPRRHIFADTKAPWFEILDDLPRFGGKSS